MTHSYEVIFDDSRAPVEFNNQETDIEALAAIADAFGLPFPLPRHCFEGTSFQSITRNGGTVIFPPR